MQFLVGGGLNYEKSPLELRERVAFRGEELGRALPLLRQELGLEEAVLLSTCNRVEYVGITQDANRCRAGWARFLESYHGYPANWDAYSQFRQGRACIDHLFELVSGLRSMVIGETEIFGQVKAAYEAAHRMEMTGVWLNRLFQTSFSAAKAARSRTFITRGNVSVSSVAVELAERLFGNLAGRSVMVLGAGEASEKTLRALEGRGVSLLLVANRTYDRACELMKELHGEAIHWSEFLDRSVSVDIVISSTSAPHYILTRERLLPLLERRKGDPLFLIDLAVPRDIDPSVHSLDGVYLYNIDDLQLIARQNLEDRAAEIVRCRRLLEPYIERFAQWADQRQKRSHGSDVMRDFRTA
ncbi:glutamyl-tRNA reductase [Methylacidimicrobium cyclopophantes]|uniref:Glutamyl-tRNA reductase n=1 Tax=Methylacidimicrobium cyclopophantes TaxID=1041766 RepID=A0A5E6MCZ0_9BACT|nr:glutamyl-tRNA reductase [Methylacidimicrobium cyclopophantes]VVM06810.1 glutamyl-tRNA reductase [Methylacidimicrobium cyclopophantes]